MYWGTEKIKIHEYLIFEGQFISAKQGNMLPHLIGEPAKR